jgi:hypothetical protein
MESVFRYWTDCIIAKFDIIRARVRVTLQLTVSQSVSLGVEPNLGLLTRDIFLSFFFFFLKVSVLSYGGALSDERSGLSFVSLQSVYSSQSVFNLTPWSESASELYRPSDRRLSAKWLPTFADRKCHVVSVTDPSGRILGFLDRSRYFSIK